MSLSYICRDFQWGAYMDWHRSFHVSNLIASEVAIIKGKSIIIAIILNQPALTTEW